MLQCQNKVCVNWTMNITTHCYRLCYTIILMCVIGGSAIVELHAEDVSHLDPSSSQWSSQIPDNPDAMLKSPDAILEIQDAMLDRSDTILESPEKSPGENASVSTRNNLPAFEEILVESLNAFYETEWEQAESLLQIAMETNKQDPRPLFFRSMIPFWEYFFVEQTPVLAQQFLERSQLAVEKSEERLEQNPADTTSVLLLSALHGYRSLVAAGESEYRIAIKSGMTGFQFTRKLMSMDSERPEVMIGKGMFYYMIGSVKKEAQWLVNTLGVSADVEMGFEQLRRASESEEQVSTEAMMMLMYLYDKEERYDDAAEVAEDLVNRHPGNKIFHFKRGEILESMGRVDASADSYRRVLTAPSGSLQELNRKADQKLATLEPSVR